LKKVIYGLKHDPHAWYDMLSKFLLSQEFSKGVVDPTLFTKKVGKDILLVKGDEFGAVLKNKARTRSKPFSLNTLCSTNQERLDNLFQLMFDEYFQPPSVESRAPSIVAALIHVDTTSTPSSTIVNQDEPPASTLLNPEDSQELV
nr:retrovirus-related Pol polyprotein from transposon TNT 1-94 [Tanacetum cinerariifolium]